METGVSSLFKSCCPKEARLLEESTNLNAVGFRTLVFRPICLTLLLFFEDSVSFTSFVCPNDLFIADYRLSFEHFCSSSNLPNIVIANR